MEALIIFIMFILIISNAYNKIDNISTKSEKEKIKAQISELEKRTNILLNMNNELKNRIEKLEQNK